MIAFRAAGHVVKFSAPGVAVPPRVGAPAQVTYDPRNPADAHDLSIGSAEDGQIYVSAGFLVLGVAVTAFLCWLAFFRQKSARLAGEVFAVESEGRHLRGR